MIKCIYERFNNFVPDVKAQALEKALDMISKKRVLKGKEFEFFTTVLYSDFDTIEMYDEFCFKAYRKKKVLTDETKKKRFKEQLLKLREKYGITE